MDRFGDAELDVRGIGGFTLQKPVDTESAEGCAAVCLANEACKSFSYAGKTGACRIYKEDADTTDVPEVQESVHHIMDNHCLAQAAPIANGEIAITTTTTTTKSCARLNPFKARPKCGRSTDDNTQCCPGLKCAGKKDKHGIKTFRCAVDVPKKSVAPGGACTVTSQCSEFRGKCNTDHYICQSKQEWMAWKAGKAAQSRTRRVSTDEAMKNATATTATAGSAIVVGIIALACIVVAVIVFSIARTNTSQSVVDVSAGTFVTETPFSPTKHDMPTVLIMV